MWTDRQFWKDATWRAFRTFCQTLAGVLAAYFSGLLSVVQGGTIAPQSFASAETLHMWMAFLYAAGISGLISLLQSIDRERAVVATPPAVAPSDYQPPPYGEYGGDIQR